MNTRKWFIILVAVFAVAGIAGTAQAQPPLPEGVQPVAGGFNGPQGVLVDPAGNIWVIDSGLGGDNPITVPDMESGEPFESGFGSTAQVVKVTPDGEQTVVATLNSLAASEMEMLGGGRLALLDGTLYATTGGWFGGVESDRPAQMGVVVSIADDGTVTEVADTWALEEADNPDGLILESHPYGIAAGPDGWLYVADAGSNTLLRVDPMSGDIETVAAFTEGFPGGFPNPARNGEVEADPVPTGIVFDDMGNGYVSFLSGAPFIPGSTKVVMITPDGEMSDYATGLTTLTDLTMGPDGNLYAVQFGIFGEQGPDPATGAIVRVKEGEASEVVVNGLPFPTSIDFDDNGNGYVTIFGVGAPGSGQVVRIDGLTMMPGEMMMQDPMGGDEMSSDMDAGAALVEERCTVCHSSDRIYSADKDEAGWTATVDRMIGNGAQLNDEERQLVIDYLSNMN